MKYKLKSYLILILLIFQIQVIAQSINIKGKVFSEESKQPLPSVNIIIKNTPFGTSTDKNGEFFFNNIPLENYTLLFTHLGYRSKEIEITSGIQDDLSLIIDLTPASVTLNSIIISSPKYQILSNEVPLPLEIVNEENILNKASPTISGILSDKSGIALKRDGIWGTAVSIRGLSGQRIVTLIDGSRVETATDLAASLSMINPNDIERIEVIKGAVSSLYGTGAMGGIINIITKEGNYNNNYYLNGSLISSFSSVNNEVASALTLKTGKSNWFLNLSGNIRNAENTKTPNGILNNSQYSDNSLSAKLGYKFFDKHEIILNYQKYFAEDVGIPGGYPIFPAQATVRYPTEKRTLFNAEYNWRPVSKIISKLSLKFFHQFIFRDVENIPNTPRNLMGILVEKITPNARHYTNGLQLQVDKAIGNEHYLIAGIDAWQRELDSRRERFLNVEVQNPTDSSASIINRIIGERPIPESKFRSIGFFIQDDYKIIKDKFSLMMGGRIDQINISNKEVRNPVYEIVNSIANYSPQNQKLIWEEKEENDFSWSTNIGLLYNFSDELNLSLSAARSFRSPSLEERYQYIDLGNLLRIGNPNLAPEKGYFFDLGLRLETSLLSFRGNVFVNFLTDLVAETPGIFEERSALINTNIGKATLSGFDLSFDINFYDNFILFSSASYVRGRDTEMKKDLPQIAPLNGRTGIKYFWEDYFSINISVALFDKQIKVAEGELKTPGYAYFDFYINSIPIDFNLLKLQIFGGVENFTNKSYRNHLATNRGFITSEPGRNFFIKLNLIW